MIKIFFSNFIKKNGFVAYANGLSNYFASGFAILAILFASITSPKVYSLGDQQHVSTYVHPVRNTDSSETFVSHNFY